MFSKQFIKKCVVDFKQNMDVNTKKHDFHSVLPQKICLLLENENLNTIGKILSCSTIMLRSIGLSDDEITQTRAAVSKAYFKPYITASECMSIVAPKWKRLKFGCKAIDEITRNGLPIRGITEISGESGCGKSQICLQLSLNVQLSTANGGLDKAAVFICTEDAFPSKRLCQLAGLYAAQYNLSSFLDKIFIEHISDTEKLEDCVLVRLPQLLNRHPVGLIVIDSVAGVFRLNPNATTRAYDMRKLVLDLQTLSDEYEFAVVCVNQVTSVIDGTNGNTLIPCLGLAWSNLVTTRIQIHKTDKIAETTSAGENGKRVKSWIGIRKFEVIFSPELPRATAEFLITENGIVDVP